MHQTSISSARGHSFVCAAMVLTVMAGCASVPPVAPAAPAATTAAFEEGRSPGQPEHPEQAFARWVVAFAATAREAGIAEETLRGAFDDVRFVPRVLDLDRRQPEFTQTVWDYLDRAASGQRVARGREKLSEFSAEAEAAAASYGVPTPVLVAIWGMESSYGANYGDIPVIDRAILRYNNSMSYALAVGLLAQGVAGGSGVQAIWPRELTALSRTQLLALQTALNERGYPSGTPDGVMGPATREGIRRYQRSLGLPADGYPTTDLLERLLQP